MPTPRKSTTRVTKAKPTLAQAEAEREAKIAEGFARVENNIGVTPATVQLWRVRTDGERAYIRTIDAAKFSLDHVRETVGPGKYWVRMFAAGAIDDEPYREYDVSIDGPEPQPEQQQRRERERDMRDELRDILREALPREDTSGQIVRELLPLLVQRPEPNTATTELLSTVLTALLGRDRREPDYLALLEKAVDLVERKIEVGGGRNLDEDSPVAVVREVARPLMDLLSRQQQPAVQLGAPANPGTEQPTMDIPTEYKSTKRTPFSVLEAMMPQLVGILDSIGDDDDVLMWAGAIEGSEPVAVEMIAGVVARIGVEKAVRKWVETFPAVLSGDRIDKLTKLVQAITETEGVDNGETTRLPH